MKAMEKAPNRRYGTPSGLAYDIERFLNGEAVSACPPSATYLFKKFAKRNKAVIATTASIAAALVVGLIGTTTLTFKALRAEEKALQANAEALRNGQAAEEKAAEYQAVVTFLTEDVLGLAGHESQLSAGLRPDPNLKLTTLLDRSLANLNSSSITEPEVKATLQETLASSFRSTGSFEKAILLRKELLEASKLTKGPKHPDTIRAMRQLASAYYDNSQLDDAEPLYESAFAFIGNIPGAEHELRALLLNDLAMLYQTRRRYEASEAAYLDCLKIRRSLLGAKHPETLGTTSNLATLYEAIGRFDEAQGLHDYVLQIRQQTLPAQDPLIADAMHYCARCFMKRGRYSEAPIQFDKALPLLEEALRINLNKWLERGKDHPATVAVRYDRVQVYLEQESYELAAPLLEELIVHFREMWTDEHETTLEAMSMLGWTYMQLDRLEEAENKLLEILRSNQLSSPSDPRTLRVRGNLAGIFYRLAKLDEAIAMDEATLTFAERELGPDHVETLSCMTRLGLCYLETDRKNEGRELLSKTYVASQNLPGAFHIAGALADSFAQDKDVSNTLKWTNRQLDDCQSNLPIEDTQIAEVIAECEARKLKLESWTEEEAAGY